MGPVHLAALVAELRSVMFSRAQSETRQRLQRDAPEVARSKLRKRLRSLIARPRLWAPSGRKLPLRGVRGPRSSSERPV
eukprot:3656585-Pyramimonas_sp.AAC.1